MDTWLLSPVPVGCRFQGFFEQALLDRADHVIAFPAFLKLTEG